jgi:hypothetical protein
MPSGRQSTITDAPNAWVPALNPRRKRALQVLAHVESVFDTCSANHATTVLVAT